MNYIVELINETKRYGADVMILEGNMIKLTGNIKREIINTKGNKSFIGFSTITELYLPQASSEIVKVKILT